MNTKTRLIKSQLKRMKLSKIQNLGFLRAGQDELGKLMKDSAVTFENVDGNGAECALATCGRCSDDGVILYLHGGGYCAGSLEYAKGFGSILCEQTGLSVLCVGYRLAPEFPYPAALEDALSAYTFLLDRGYDPKRILVMGESAGGSLTYSLCLKIKEQGLPKPAGVVAISPWMDMTLEDPAIDELEKKDPLISRELLNTYRDYYAYGEDWKNPFLSPLFGDFTAIPPSLLFVGSDEVLLGDAVRTHEKLLGLGPKSRLRIARDMWHVYLLYPVQEAVTDMALLTQFVHERLA